MNVREAMTAHPATVTPETPIADAQALMRRGHFRHLPVVTGGTLTGIVTERDLHVADAGDGAGMARQRPVRTVMSSPVVTIGPEDPLDQAAATMLANKFSALPVTEGDAVVGIVTQSDIFRAFVSVLGVMEAGTRIQIKTDDLTMALALVSAVAQAQGVRILAVVSEPGRGVGEASLVVRFGTVMIARLVAALRAAGLDVSEPIRGADTLAG